MGIIGRRIFSSFLLIFIFFSFLPVSGSKGNVQAQNRSFSVSGRVTGDIERGLGVVTVYDEADYKIFLPLLLGSSSYDLGEMVYVPAGEFQMGCDPAHNSGVACPADELPLHTVYLDAYYIDINHVTNAQYAQCVDDGVCFLPSDTSFYDETDFENHPVVWVNWAEAMTYCDWMGKDLPTEAQWEKAARGTTLRTFPWGDNPATCDLANYENCVNMTTIVGSYPDGASPYGVLDMAGNVYDWVYDWYSSTEYEDRACGTGSLPACNNPTGPTSPTSGNKKGLRGGSYMWSSASIRTHRRSGEDGWSGAALFGFRCASTAP
jgi:formylglycine-generating enzyme required for sulfatase activity